VVVIGAGLGGLRVVESLRRLGYSGQVVLVGQERWAPYDRPPLSKDFLKSEHDTPPYLRAINAYDGLCELRLGEAAVGLDGANRAVMLGDGEAIAFDAAVISTGGRPRQLMLDGQETLGQTLRTVDDAWRLKSALRDQRSLVVVGAGFVGCEIAASVRSVGAEVTLVESLPGPLYRVLGEQMSATVAAMHEEAGVDVRCGVTVVSAGAVGNRTRLTLSDGSTVQADVIAAGLGVVPAVDWLADSQIDIDDGITCNGYGETSIPGVYAIGDAAAWWYPSAGRAVRVEHWTTTAAQAVVVANNIVGRPEGLMVFDPLHYFWSDQYGTKMQCHGTPRPDGDVEVFTVGTNRHHALAVYGTEGRASAVVGIGVARAVLKLRPLIEAKLPFAQVVSAASELAAA
jgi:3-phenylpropionate/trans-cinnamate dioxygenase ferredoxin reductase subunit